MWALHGAQRPIKLAKAEAAVLTFETESEHELLQQMKVRRGIC